MSEPKKMDVVTMIMIARLVIMIIELWQESESNKKVKKLAKKIGLTNKDLALLVKEALNEI